MIEVGPVTTGERLARLEVKVETVRKDVDRMRATIARAGWAGWVIVAELAVGLLLFLVQG